jgi:hypothetical protein
LQVASSGLWILLAAHLVALWGLSWDIRWHLLIGRDSFWIAPQRLTQLELERENFELRRANEILKKASAYFARAEFDRRAK